MAKKKSAAKKNTSLNAKPKVSKAKKSAASKTSGAPFNEQDPKRRLGNYGGAGEHPRQGGRTSGIVGQTKQKTGTEKRTSQGKKKK
jgi:hypothetical protein